MSVTTEGEYHYFQDGVLMPVTERFFKFTDGDYVKVNSHRHASPHRFHVDAHSGSAFASGMFSVLLQNDHFAQVAVQWGGDVRVERTVDSQATVQLYPRPTDLVVAPLMRVFLAPTIRRLVAMGGVGTVLVPNIIDPDKRDDLFHPIFEQRQAEFLHTETLTVDAGTFETECYSYRGGAYDASARFWLCDDVLVAYRFNNWLVNLISFKQY